MNSRLEPAIEFAGVHYRFDGNRELIRNLTLQVVPGDTLMLLGRSGSGKTTTLKLINRLLAPSAGEIRVDGVPAMQWDPIKLRRHIGYAIQDVGLFPHYTVEQNVAVVPKLEHWEASRINKRVQEVMQLVGLPPEQFAQRYPDQLSGGQKQRVGLARALAADPPILLMDEPFGALDPITRAEVQMEFKHLQQKLAKTVVFVTHDVGEALLLGTRIAVMEDGSLRGIYTPAEFLKSSDQFAKLYVDAFLASQQTVQP